MTTASICLRDSIRFLNGMCYNSYVICDEKTAVMDTVDARFTHEWLDNLAEILKGKAPII